MNFKREINIWLLLVFLILMLVLAFLLLETRLLGIYRTGHESDAVIIRNDKTYRGEVTVMIAGDVMLGRYVNLRTRRENDFLWPWQKTRDVLREADITLINLESPLIHDCPVTVQGMKFCGDAGHVAGLREAGIDVASLANNHAENYDGEGLNETRSLLETAGIATIGDNKPAIIERGGTRFAFLAYNDVGPDSQQGMAKASGETVAAEVTAAKEKSEVVIVMFHWGNEYTDQPTSRQRALAHLAIDAGADLVVGAHPHWVQPAENYKGNHIAYSLGNFIFDQNWSQKTREGIIGKYVFRGA